MPERCAHRSLRGSCKRPAGAKDYFELRHKLILRGAVPERRIPEHTCRSESSGSFAREQTCRREFSGSLRREHLEHIRLAPGVGGKAACRWQRALRAECIANGVTSQDVTNNPLYDWTQLLRAADRRFAEHIIGEGIVNVVFRIIDTERDSNYSNVDRHGKHFFEFARADGSTMQWPNR